MHDKCKGASLVRAMDQLGWACMQRRQRVGGSGGRSAQEREQGGVSLKRAGSQRSQRGSSPLPASAK